ncbi:glycosyl hydrolase [Salmonella enterica subsp. enterica serovar Choleraesuis]|nr:glycosyl hydrolase [Salmonella enterica subsp. enterica serovar Choleraesuis]
MIPDKFSSPQREKGYMGLSHYAAIGDGRSVALIASDGAIDWWCAPNMDSPPLFDRLLDADQGGYFQLEPEQAYHVRRRYRPGSNVLETRFETAEGSVLLTESMNSSLAGRLPWCEIARRIEGVSGRVAMRLRFRAGTVAGTRSPWVRETSLGHVLHLGELMAMLNTSEDISLQPDGVDNGVTARFVTSPGSRSIVALLATQNEPLTCASLTDIDNRIELTDSAWRQWSGALRYDGRFASMVRRSALALKFLLYSPTGALAAAATTSLPEGVGGRKNYDYRFAWVRDACLIIRSFISIGALEETQAAYSWLTETILRHKGNWSPCYTLRGDFVSQERYLPMPGYRDSQPVRVGNNACAQLQLGMYGDMLETARLFVNAGHILDSGTAHLLATLADSCADSWRQMDSGIWELPELQHYTHSRMACWQALDSAIQLAEIQELEPAGIKRWQAERDRIARWIEQHCWSEARQAYVFYPGTNRLDAALTLCWRYGMRVNPQRMQATYRAIIEELGHDGAMLYRYSGVEQEENTFVACSFWMVEALAKIGLRQEASVAMYKIISIIRKTRKGSIFNEMYDPRRGEWWGNMPQGLSHLALIGAADALR